MFYVGYCLYCKASCTMELRPSEIRYSQDSIARNFGRSTGHPFRAIGQTLDDILSGQCNVNSIPRISVIYRHDHWFTVDNRRLWVFQKAEERGKCDKIFVYETSFIDDEKFTTTNEGRSVRVRGDPGGYLWKRYLVNKERRTPRTYSYGAPAYSQRSPVQTSRPSYEYSASTRTVSSAYRPGEGYCNSYNSYNNRLYSAPVNSYGREGRDFSPLSPERNYSTDRSTSSGSGFWDMCVIL